MPRKGCTYSRETTKSKKCRSKLQHERAMKRAATKISATIRMHQAKKKLSAAKSAAARKKSLQKHASKISPPALKTTRLY